MNRREFIRRISAAALAATPAMQAAAFVRDFGMPVGNGYTRAFDAADVEWSATSGEVVAQWLAVYSDEPADGVGIVDLTKPEWVIEWSGRD
jgi:hypothetical protein